MGRPSAYTSEFAETILAGLEAGDSLHIICGRHPDLPHPATIRRWIASNHEGFRDKYARVKETMAEVYAEEIVSIADDSSEDELTTEDGRAYANNEFINRSRLRVDTRKWLMSKLLPKKYGERTQHEVSGADGGPLTIAWLPPAK